MVFTGYDGVCCRRLVFPPSSVPPQRDRKRERERERERERDRNPEKARMFWDKPIHSGLVSLSHASDSTKVFCLAECGLGHHG